MHSGHRRQLVVVHYSCDFISCSGVWTKTIDWWEMSIGEAK